MNRGKLKDYFGIYFWVIIFIISLMVINYSMTTIFPNYKEIAAIPTNVLMTLLAATLGGAFTLLGVEKTFNKQSKLMLIKKFPMKIYYLDELIKELQELKNIVRTSNSQFLILDKNKIASLFNIATEIDGYIYFETRNAHSEFSMIIDSMFNDPDKRIYIKNENNEDKLIKGKESENELRVKDLQLIVHQLLEKCDLYRNDFIEYYNKNIDREIYHPIE